MFQRNWSASTWRKSSFSRDFKSDQHKISEKMYGIFNVLWCLHTVIIRAQRYLFWLSEWASNSNWFAWISLCSKCYGYSKVPDKNKQRHIIKLVHWPLYVLSWTYSDGKIDECLATIWFSNHMPLSQWNRFPHIEIYTPTFIYSSFLKAQYSSKQMNPSTLFPWSTNEAVFCLWMVVIMYSWWAKKLTTGGSLEKSR